MDRLYGRSLLDRQKDNDFDLRDAVRAVSRAAKIAHNCHENGLVHRDINPRNILIDDSDKIFLVDFGIARPLTNESRMPRCLAGTYGYVPPEQAEKCLTDRGWDVYSLGATLYFLLCGRPPFNIRKNENGKIETDDKFYSRVAKTDPTRPSEVSGRVIPDKLESICMRCLSRDTSVRFQTAKLLALALEPYEELTPAKRFSSITITVSIGMLMILITICTSYLLHQNKPTIALTGSKRTGDISEDSPNRGLARPKISGEATESTVSTKLPSVPAEKTAGKGGLAAQTSSLENTREAVFAEIEDWNESDELQVKIGKMVTHFGKSYDVLKGNDIYFLHLDGLTNADAKIKIIADLASDTGIHSLSLAHSDLTDTGLEYLYKWKALRFVYLEGTSISLAGVKSFLQSHGRSLSELKLCMSTYQGPFSYSAVVDYLTSLPAGSRRDLPDDIKKQLFSDKE